LKKLLKAMAEHGVIGIIDRPMPMSIGIRPDQDTLNIGQLNLEGNQNDFAERGAKRL
jgi:hypothetical protein